MSIQQKIILRYNSAGHVRLEIPKCLCHEDAANFLNHTILKINGVYRVNLFRNKQKLSIRFITETLEFNDLIQQLFRLISHAEEEGLLKEKTAFKKTSSLIKETLSHWQGTRWAQEKYTETKETVQAISILTKFGFKKKDILDDPEKYLITFFNDILLLFLIKTHWNLITKKWMLSPLTYRYNWLATFYLMYLFIRAKTTKSK
jgi:hypothetical protein